MNEFEIKFKTMPVGPGVYSKGCLSCGNLVADEDLHRRWHLDLEENNKAVSDEWTDIRALTRGELENLLNWQLSDWQWDRIKDYVRYREKR